MAAVAIGSIDDAHAFHINGHGHYTIEITNINIQIAFICVYTNERHDHLFWDTLNKRIRTERPYFLDSVHKHTVADLISGQNNAPAVLNPGLLQKLRRSRVFLTEAGLWASIDAYSYAHDHTVTHAITTVLRGIRTRDVTCQLSCVDHVSVSRMADITAHVEVLLSLLGDDRSDLTDELNAMRLRLKMSMSPAAATQNASHTLALLENAVYMEACQVGLFDYETRRCDTISEVFRALRRHIILHFDKQHELNV
jgi:hypothetical protein